ncbi:MAG: erythromycin esterase family protein [Gammaproteobacteria bacterium]
MHARTPFLTVTNLAEKLDGDAGDYDSLIELAADKQFVLLGEATHGTREFYCMRAEITRRLITEHGFEAVAIEGDWPDTWRVNRFVQGEGEDGPEEALSDFQRFPLWMWRNREMLSFITRLHNYNATLPAGQRVGIYGLDLYSMYRSADAVIGYLEKIDPEQAETARQRYTLLDHVREPQEYGYQAAFGLRPAARDAVIKQLLELQASQQHYLASDGLAAQDEQFMAERNAQVVVNAENYYRAMFGSRQNTWNLRDSHMRDTLLALAAHRIRRGGTGRIVVWAHNSHQGDARATEAHANGEWSLGQLVREHAGDTALLVGFTTYTGHVSAASEWDGQVEHKWVRPALKESYEYLFHSTRLDRFFLPLALPAAERLREIMLERAIGVIYAPNTERASHYFDVSLAGQFDAIFHLDETTAIEPLDIPHHWHRPEAVTAGA